MENSNNLVGLYLMVQPEQIIQFAFQQPLENIVKQLSINYSYLEIIEALTKVERDKETLRKQEQLVALKEHFSNKLAELAKADEQLKTDLEVVEKEHQQNIGQIKKQVLIEVPVVPASITKPTKKPLREFVCNYKGCGQTFSTGERKAKYCSLECRNKQFKIQSEEMTTETRNCLNCEQSFKVSVFGKNKKYCSIICSATHYRATHKEQCKAYSEKHKNKKLLQQSTTEQPALEAERLI